MKEAIIINDVVNDIVHLDGLANGCAAYVRKNNTLDNINKAIAISRKKNALVIFMKVAFKEQSLEKSSTSLFYKRQDANALKADSWGTEFHSNIQLHPHDLCFTKNRINPFFSTPLDSILRNNSVKHLVLTGVSTDLAILTAAFSAHDNNYRTTIIEDACGSLNNTLHESAIAIMRRFTNVVTVDEYK